MPAWPLLVGVAIACLCWCASSAVAQAPVPTDPSSETDLASAGFQLLKTYCYGCHGATSNGNAALDVTDRESLLDPEYEYVTPGDLEKSYLWRRIADGEMPPEGQPQPSAEEKETIRKWIEVGAPKPLRERRRFQRDKDVLQAILTDLQQAESEDRPYLRYFSLVHLFNNPDVSEFELRLYRAALAKALNSLSWESTMVTPAAINPEESIFRIDLRELNWSREDWQAVLRVYPYGLRLADGGDADIAHTEEQLELYSDAPLSVIRADWFAVTATRPPLYHQLLKIPETDQKLEDHLGVNFKDNFRKNRLARAGFTESGVSTANRLVERHPAAYGAYWKSYDFRPNNRDGELARLPLGPRFQGNAFAEHAFRHDGGELIFTLPNGLQGYMLVDEQGKRIDGGPIEVVRDLKETSGSPVVVNGLSCMHCHQHGMIRFKDSIRASSALSGEPRKKVEAIYLELDEMDSLVEEDRRSFLDALAAAVGPFLQVKEDKERPIESFAEPIGAIARYYGRNIELQEAALELGLEDSSVLKAAVRSSSELRALGLGALAENRSLKRSTWHSQEFVTSPFQETARILDRGSPRVFLGNAR